MTKRYHLRLLVKPCFERNKTKAVQCRFLSWSPNFQNSCMPRPQLFNCMNLLADPNCYCMAKWREEGVVTMYMSRNSERGSTSIPVAMLYELVPQKSTMVSLLSHKCTHLMLTQPGRKACSVNSEVERAFFKNELATVFLWWSVLQ